MAGSTPSETRPQRRSRSGCRECRRRHRRCDEAKPSCSYCSSVSIACEYSRELSWGGRPFQKSRFGQCLGRDLGVVKVTSEDAAPRRTAKRRKVNSNSTSTRRDSFRSQFVYTTAGTSSAECALIDQEVSDICSEEHIATETANDPVHQFSKLDDLEESDLWESSSLQKLEYSPELYPLSPRSRNLLGYFQYGMSRSFSCHEGIQHNICSALIPMAMNSPHLMAAMLCAAASHRLSIGLEHLDDVIRLRSIAIQRLKVALTSSTQYDLMAALGTSLVLCMSEIVSPEATGGDWRVHLSGLPHFSNGLKDTFNPWNLQ